MKHFLLKVIVLVFILVSTNQVFASASIQCSKMTQQVTEAVEMDHSMHSMHQMDYTNTMESDKTSDCCGSADSCPMQQCAVTVPVYLSQASFLYEFNAQHSETYTYSTFYPSRYLDTPYRPPILG
ncbi:MAG: hypothetical protein HWE16_11455 [Gammaproteobacteria bacterium]|nr:hypothetical protein [Gammaproteobacteria bacterium]